MKFNRLHENFQDYSLWAIREVFKEWKTKKFSWNDFGGDGA